MLPPEMDTGLSPLERPLQFPSEQNNLSSPEANENGPEAVSQTVQKAIADEPDNVKILLKRQHNACLPISRLPTELLIAIFRSTLPPVEDAWQMPHAPPISRLISVCHTWRKTTLGTPALWTVVSSWDSFSHVERALLLSNPMPLDVVYHCHGPVNLDLTSFFKAVSQTSPRWRRLDITYNGTLEELEWMEDVSASMLENLYLEFDPEEDDWSPPRPLNLFKGSPLPKLQMITLIGVPIVWELGQLAGGRLRHLELGQIRSDAPSVPQILDIIRLSPLLATFSLHRVPVVTGNSAVLPTLRPQALKEFSLAEMPSAATTQLLLCIRPPQCPLFTVRNTITQEEATDFFSPVLESAVQTMLRDRKGERIYIVFTSLTMMVSNGQYSHLQINGEAAIAGLEWISPPDDVPRALQAVLSIQNVVELTLQANADDWHHGATLLRSLALPREEAPPGEHEWSFPQLQLVTLGGTYSLIPIFIQALRARLGLDNTLRSQGFASSYPPPIKVVYVRPDTDAHRSFSRSELDELQDIIGAGGGNVYWRSRLWKDWPKDQPHDQPYQPRIGIKL
ncbi:hypothetical protein FS837_005664 [Tulasnella sp. UAMH 9824]|nr:hypothetical protein FS837_005664 [Tulasnella sp. UAMH 9824]